VSFPAGTASGATFQIAVAILDDGALEPVETLRLALSNPSGAVLGAPSTGTITIVDDDDSTLPTIAVSTTAGAPARPFP